MDVAFESAKSLASLIRRRKIGCLELLDLYIARMEKHNPRINAIVTTDLDAARKRARAADAALRKGQPWGRCTACP